MSEVSSTPLLPDVSVLIPTLGRESLARTLEAISRGTRYPAEVLVVDQGPPGGSETIAARADTGPLRVRVLRSRGRGRAVGLNEGLRALTTSRFVVTDDDCIPEPGWLEAMSMALDRHPDALITGRIEAFEGGQVPVVSTSREPSIQRRPRLTFDTLSGGNMGAHRSLIGALGDFDDDPRIATAEDGELAYRALRAGVPLVFEPASGVAHVDWREGPARAAQLRSYAVSHGAFYGQRLRRGDLFIAMRALLHLARVAKRWVRGTLSGDADRALNGRSYLAGLPRGMLRGLARPPSPSPTPSPAGPSRVAVLILTLDQCRSTLRALECLESERNARVEILVWDNASTDGTAEAVERRFPHVHVHHSHENLGVAGGRNAAARLAMQRFEPTHLLFLDNDMEVEPGFVDHLLEPFRQDPLVAQTQAKLRFLHEPELLNDGGGFDVSWWSGRTSPVGFREPDRGQRDHQRPCLPCGGATLTRADVFRELGGFDERYNPFGPEDLDFSLRVREAGYRALYVPSAVAYHAVTTTFEGGRYTELYARHKARNWQLLMRRHASLRHRLAFYLVGAPFLTLRMLAREGPSKGFAALRGWIRALGSP